MQLPGKKSVFVVLSLSLSQKKSAKPVVPLSAVPLTKPTLFHVKM